MSSAKVKRFSIFLLLLICSIFLFACETRTPVEDIHFADESIVLLVGDTYSPNVSITPSYATNRSYTITSENPSVVTVIDNVLTATQEGEAVIRVVSLDNPMREDVMTVSVRRSVTTLQTPRVSYNSTNQTINFDMIANASSYTLRINGTDINLGNSTSYSLRDYENLTGSAFDQMLTISVRANAPTYSHAFNNSSFSTSLKVYQAKSVANARIVGGILNFDKTSATNYQISLDGSEISTTSANRVDLTNVNANLSGYLDLTVVSLVDDALKTDATATYYNSLPVTLRVKVMDAVNARMIENTINWQSNAEVESYNVYVDNILKANTTNNYFDLSTLEDFEDIVYISSGHTLRVEPVINRASVNVIKVVSSSADLDFNRLQTPTLTVLNNIISWNAIAGASSYVVSVSYSEISTSIITQNNSFSLDNYPSNQNYTVSVQAISSYNENYLSSFVDSVNIIKRAEVELSIDNYILSFNTTNSDSYLVEFLTVDDAYSNTIVADSDNYTLDLSTFNFNIGENSVYVTHLGNNAEIFDSATTSVKFVQLTDEEDISMSNGVVSVERDAINENATYRFRITGGDVDFTVDSTSYEFNTTSEELENFLPAGNYSISLYILGDGKNTFSIANDGLSALSYEFEVLGAPILSVPNKAEQILSITEIANAENYVIYYKVADNFETFATISNNTCEFDIEENELVFRAQSIGNGSTTLNSCYSDEITVQKLSTPTLTYDRSTDVIGIVDNNSPSIVNGYVLTVNGAPTDYDFTSAYENFVVGDNEFIVYIEAVDASNNTFYLNSDSFTLNINKVDGEAVFNINGQGQLIIEPLNQDAENDLVLSITIGDSEMLFETDGTSLVYNDYSLDYVYNEGQYIINLLNNAYEPIISELDSATNFTVKVKFVPQGETSVDSSYSTEQIVQIENESLIGRNGQNLTIRLAELTHNYQNYSLLVNDSVMIDLDSSAIVDSEAGYVLVDVSYIYSFLEDNYSQFEVSAITKNINSTSENLRLPKKSDSTFVARADQLELTQSKDNNVSNNSVVISFNIDQGEFDKTYQLSVFNLIDGVKANEYTKIYSNSDADSGVISFNLDEVSLTGTLYITVTTLTTGDKLVDGNTVLMFNSLESERIEISKLDAVMNVYVSDGILHFDSVENAVGYEIYNVTGSVQQKLNNGILQDTTYGLTNLTGEAYIAVKAIADLTGSNSNLSESIHVNKLATPTLNIVNGELNLTLSSVAIGLLQNESVDIKIQASNGLTSFDYELVSDGISVENNTVQILSDALNASGVMNFGLNSPLNENLTFKLVVNYTSTDTDEEIYYINSNSASISVYGLLQVTNLRKNSTENDYDEYIETISFDANANNVLNANNLVNGYTFRVVTNDATHYSTDTRLKYRQIASISDVDGTIEYEYLSYSELLTSTNFVFPYGYDENEDGLITDDEVFRDGTFAISVKAVANVISGYNLINSTYSQAIEFSILATPNLNIINGTLNWDGGEDYSYIVRVYDSVNEDKALLEIDNVSENYFDFSNSIFNDYIGLYGVSVQAISNNPLVVNSRESDAKLVLRLPEVVDAKVDDGYLVLTANSYFSLAEITFVDTIDPTRTQIITYSRAVQASELLDELEIETWEDYNAENVSSLFTSSNFIALNYDSLIMSVMPNRSYTVNVRLIGNSDNNRPIVSSKSTINAGMLNATKLSSTTTEVEKGVFKFDTIDEYKNLNINYNFNNAVIAQENTIWNNMRVYKVEITASNIAHEIYALDYYAFETAISTGIISAQDYEIVENRENLYAIYKYSTDETNYLYFNVFENNTINLRDYDYIYYYQITNEVTDSESTFTGSTTISSVNLSAGGAFVVSISLLGGDSIIVENTTRTSNIAYLNADVTDLNTFIRYGNNSVSTQNGQVLIQNMQIVVEEQVVDYPIYKLRVNLLNDAENVTNIYLYHSDVMTLEQAQTITGDSDGIYSETVFSDTQQILFDFAEYFTYGSYQIDVQTLAGLSSDSEQADYLLNSRVPTTKYNLRKISSTQFVANSGDLQFDLAYITGAGGETTYIYNYEITLHDQTIDQEYVYNITSTSEGVTVQNNRIVYTLPSEITTTLGEEVTIDNDHSFTIKLRALALNEQYVINGSYLETDGIDYTMQFVRSSGVSNVRIEDGELRWTVEEDKFNTQVRIDLAFLDANSQTQHITFATLGTQVNDEHGNYLYHSYAFTDGLYNITSTGGQTYINSSVDYTVSICVIGTSGSNNAIISSAYSEGILMNRLSAVNSSSITAVNGVLTWSAVPDAVSYVVTMSVGGNEYNFNVETNSIDFSEIRDVSNNLLSAGQYNVYVRAIGDNLITAMRTNASSTFTKLSTVTGIAIDTTDSNYISWNAVSGAEGYFVTFTYGDNLVETTMIEGGSTTRVLVPENIVGQFEVSVSARGVGISRTLNGEAGTFVSSTSRPSAVNAINFDTENQRYYWSVADDFLPSDTLRVSYNLYEYVSEPSSPTGSTLSSSSSQQVVTINANDANSYYEENNVRYYFFKPTVMGMYTNFVVQVTRANSNNSPTRGYENVDLNLYSYGAGTSENPYRIKNSTHLMNITYNESANYELIESVNLSDVNIANRISEFDAIISSNFSGTLNGNNSVIYGFNNLVLTSANSFALFNTLNNATIYDLSIGLTDSDTNISNSFANNYSDVVNLSVLGINANNSTIENVDVNRFVFTLSGNGTLSGNVNASGLVANLTNSQIVDSNATVTFNFNLTFTSQVNVGGMVAVSASSSLTSTSGTFNSTLTLTQSNSNNSFNYVGGVVAQFVGEDARTSEISNAESNVNLTNVYANYMGGIAGLVQLARITDSVATGNITNQAINKNTFMGGVAGVIQSSIIESAGTEIAFTLRVTNNSTTSIYIGALAGNITTISNISNTINSCYSYYEVVEGQTTISGGVVTMGIYGRNVNNTPINNWTITG